MRNFFSRIKITVIFSRLTKNGINGIMDICSFNKVVFTCKIHEILHTDYII